jgi:hypothetical protein
VARAGDQAGVEVDLLPGDRPEVGAGEAREQSERDGDLEVVAPGGVEEAAALLRGERLAVLEGAGAGRLEVAHEVPAGVPDGGAPGDEPAVDPERPADPGRPPAPLGEQALQHGARPLRHRAVGPLGEERLELVLGVVDRPLAPPRDLEVLQERVDHLLGGRDRRRPTPEAAAPRALGRELELGLLLRDGTERTGAYDAFPAALPPLDGPGRDAGGSFDARA